MTISCESLKAPGQRQQSGEGRQGWLRRLLQSLFPPAISKLHLGSVQVILTLGVVLAQIINIATGKYYPWGWRVSLGLAGLPAIVLTIGGIVLPDTPNSLVERGFEAEGRKVRASPTAAPAQTGMSLQLCRISTRLQATGLQGTNCGR